MLSLIQKRKYSYWFSGLLTVACIVALSTWGLKLGIDFKGGTLMEVRFSDGKTPQTEEIRSALETLGVKSLVLQSLGENHLSIRYMSSDDTQNEKVFEAIQSFDEGSEQLRVDFVGPSVSDQIKKNAFRAIATAIIGIILYIAWAFRKVSYPMSSWYYGIMATIALFHDLFLTIGAFSLLGHFYGIEVDASFIAALLTILGYSVNDTIVVYDRVRENLIRSRAKDDFEETVNRSLNETIARSFNTSFTVMIVLAAIVAYGGESIRYFALALLIGVASGTYSSIYVASALLVTGYQWKKNH